MRRCNRGMEGVGGSEVTDNVVKMCRGKTLNGIGYSLNTSTTLTEDSF